MANPLVLHLTARPLGDHRAALHHQVLIGQFLGKVVVLLAQQQLAIARALAPGPKLLILDEPTEGIQPSIIKDIGRVIRMLARERGMAVLLCEQYYDFAEELADQYLVMQCGAVIAQGPGPCRWC